LQYIYSTLPSAHDGNIGLSFICVNPLWPH